MKKNTLKIKRKDIITQVMSYSYSYGLPLGLWIQKKECLNGFKGFNRMSNRELKKFFINHIKYIHGLKTKSNTEIMYIIAQDEKFFDAIYVRDTEKDRWKQVVFDFEVV